MRQDLSSNNDAREAYIAISDIGCEKCQAGMRWV